MAKSKDIQLERSITAYPEALFSAFTTSAGLREWLCDVADVHPYEGGRIYMWWTGGYYAIGEFRYVQPGQGISFTWHGRDEPGQTYVSVQLIPMGECTTVRLTHSGIESNKLWKKARKQIRKGWNRALENLQSVHQNGADLRWKRQAETGLYGLHPVTLQQVGSTKSKVYRGLMVEGVLAESPAEQAGLQPGDIVLKLGRFKTPVYGRYQQALHQYRPGKIIRISYLRAEEKQSLKLKLGQKEYFSIPDSSTALAEWVDNKYSQIQARLTTLLADASPSACEYKSAEYALNTFDILAQLVALEREIQNSIAATVDGQDTSTYYNPPAKISAQAKKYVYASAAALLDELKRSHIETKMMIALLPGEFQDRKGAFWRMATNLFDSYRHAQVLIDAIDRNLSTYKHTFGP